MIMEGGQDDSWRVTIILIYVNIFRSNIPIAIDEKFLAIWHQLYTSCSLIQQPSLSPYISSYIYIISSSFPISAQVSSPAGGQQAEAAAPPARGRAMVPVDDAGHHRVITLLCPRPRGARGTKLSVVSFHNEPMMLTDPAAASEFWKLIGFVDP